MYWFCKAELLPNSLNMANSEYDLYLGQLFSVFTDRYLMKKLCFRFTPDSSKDFEFQDERELCHVLVDLLREQLAAELLPMHSD